MAMTTLFVTDEELLHAPRDDQKYERVDGQIAPRWLWETVALYEARQLVDPSGLGRWMAHTRSRYGF